MKKSTFTRIMYIFGTAFVALPMVLGGCSVLPKGVQYDEKTIKYTSSPEKPDDKQYSAKARVTKSKVGQYDNATAYYVARQRGTKFPEAKVLTPQRIQFTETARQKATEPEQGEKTVVLLEISDVLFDFDKAIIKERYVPELDKWVEYFKNNPDQTANIYGHTDSTGPEKYNQGLSERRAKAVVKYLVDHGVEPERLTAQGFGETEPVAGNDTREGRQKNRRVEMEY